MFDLACVGINHFEEHFEKAFEDNSEFPYKVFKGQDEVRQGSTSQVFDPMGRVKVIEFLRKGDVDILFVMRERRIMNNILTRIETENSEQPNGH